ncbi:Fc.00g043960.m01.CDS01 [Cosmosporella sp. VM-42]
MTVLRASPGSRIIIAVLITVGLLTYFTRTLPDFSHFMADDSASSPVAGLNVTLHQTSTLPPIISVKVTNTNPESVTVLSYASPLDGLALQLGLLSITPDGASAPLDIATVQVRRKWPPGPDSLITIDPGRSQEQEIELREPIVSMESLGKRVSVQLKGKWDAVWTKGRDEIDKSDFEQGKGAKDAYSGAFLSNSLDVTLS